MRHSYEIVDKCASCGSSHAVAHSYCCSNNAHVVCEKCGNKRLVKLKSIMDRLGKPIGEEIGFLGTEDVRDMMGVLETAIILGEKLGKLERRRNTNLGA